MRERTTWNREIARTASGRTAEDPRAMNQDHLKQQPAPDDYVTGGPSEFAEDVHPSAGTWKAEYDHALSFGKNPSFGARHVLSWHVEHGQTYDAPYFREPRVGGSDLRGFMSQQFVGDTLTISTASVWHVLVSSSKAHTSTL